MINLTDPETATTKTVTTMEPVDVRIRISAMWAAMLLLFAYVDIFAFWRKDVIEGALAERVPDVDITINQGFLAGSMVFVAIPCLMVAVSVIAAPKVNRALNIGLSLLYAVLTAAFCIGETWIYYLLGSVLEIALLLNIARTAWKWNVT